MHQKINRQTDYFEDALKKTAIKLQFYLLLYHYHNFIGSSSEYCFIIETSNFIV